MIPDYALFCAPISNFSTASATQAILEISAPRYIAYQSLVADKDYKISSAQADDEPEMKPDETFELVDQARFAPPQK
jgi:hypothetical protein